MKFLIIDSNALLHRAFHALPALTDKEGKQTGAIYGYFLTFFKAIKDISPDFVLATFDTPAPTFRHKKFKSYKAKREKAPDEFYEQIPKTKEILSAFSVPIFEKGGFEADDIIATLTKKILKKQIHPQPEVYILTGDFDTLQLVDENTKVYTLGRGIKETVIYDKDKVIEKFGILPEQMVDFKALAGDPSDNIPGATGIGKKTAAELLLRFGSIEKLYKALKEEKKLDGINPRIKKILLEQKEQVFFSQILARAQKDVPLEMKIEECKFGNFDENVAKNTLLKYGFHSLVNRILESKEIQPIDNLEKEKDNGKLF